MSRKAPWKWSKQKHTAAQLVACDEWGDDEIAEQLDISRRTLFRWKGTPEFAAQVELLVAESGTQALAFAIARKTRRIRNLDDRLRRMQAVIEARSTDDSFASVPGGDTGLLVRSFKTVGAGESATVVEEFAVDTALLREMRATEQQAAQELGQWVTREQHELTGPGFKVYLGFDPREVLGQKPTT